MKKVILGMIILSLTACVQYSARSPIAVNQYEKRLNTIACHDRDDWYLDGYRVGKDYAEYSQSQLNQRIRYCGGVTSAQRSAWLDGFHSGNGGSDNSYASDSNDDYDDEE